MNIVRRSRPLLLALCALRFSPHVPVLSRSRKAKSTSPRVGQQGKDVVWVPTPQELVDKMLDMAKVTPKDYLIDLGSGDGRTVITAAKRGLRAHGIEYNPDMVELSKTQRRQRGRQRQGDVCQSRPVRKRFLGSPGDHDVSSAADKSETPAKDSRSQTRNAHRLELVYDGRVGSGRKRYGRRRVRSLVHRPSMDRPGQGRRDLATTARRAELEANLSDAFRHDQDRQ